MPIIYCDRTYAGGFGAGDFGAAGAVAASFGAAGGLADGRGGVDIWRIRIPDHICLLDTFRGMLTGEETERALGYHREKDRQRFIIARGGLRVLLGSYSNRHPEDICFAQGRNKKPFMEGAGSPGGAGVSRSGHLAGGAGLHYNVTHSGDLVLIAIAPSEIGVDAEQMTDDFHYTDVVAVSFSPEERMTIQAAPSPRGCFYMLWTRKEALVKATGKGLDEDLPLVPCLDGTHIVGADVIGSPASWTVRSFTIGDHYLGSVAHDPGVNSVRFLDFRAIFPLYR